MDPFWAALLEHFDTFECIFKTLHVDKFKSMKVLQNVTYNVLKQGAHLI